MIQFLGILIEFHQKQVISNEIDPLIRNYFKKCKALVIENYKNIVNFIKAMETGQNLNGISITIGSIIGYCAILAGIIMTILLLETIVLGK